MHICECGEVKVGKRLYPSSTEIDNTRIILPSTDVKCPKYVPTYMRSFKKEKLLIYSPIKIKKILNILSKTKNH